MVRSRWKYKGRGKKAREGRRESEKRGETERLKGIGEDMASFA
jgi:hypothetical protein